MSAPLVHWRDGEQALSAHWRNERGSPGPTRVQVIDDTLNADAAYRLACDGWALVWRGDFHNARQLLQALARRVDRKPARKKRGAPAEAATAATRFHLHRQAQAQRARVLSALLVPVAADYSIPLRRAPDAHAALTNAWGPAPTQLAPDALPHLVALRELLGITSAQEWRRTGVEIAALGAAPNNRIHPWYGVFSPVRGEYINLVAQAPLPGPDAGALTAFDIGTGTGVLSAVLARRGVGRIVATDLDARALGCARANLAQLGVASQVEVVSADLFPQGQADLVVCNPPWLPARASAPIERAVYDEGSAMLLGFLRGLDAHLAPGGEAWLVLSDLAEHLGLRTRAFLMDAIAQAGLSCVGRLDTRPHHPKTLDAQDALHAARAAEITSLWRLRRA